MRRGGSGSWSGGIETIYGYTVHSTEEYTECVSMVRRAVSSMGGPEPFYLEMESWVWTNDLR